MKHFSEEHKAKISKASQRLWDDPVYREKMLKKQRELGLRTYKITT
jgi:hypothetical protein